MVEEIDLAVLLRSGDRLAWSAGPMEPTDLLAVLDRQLNRVPRVSALLNLSLQTTVDAARLASRATVTALGGAVLKEGSMRRTWTIIGVADVARSLAWYQTLLGLPKSAPAHDYFGQILDADGTVLLCLHQWGTHGHPPLTRPDPTPGNGLLLFFRVDGFDEALPRARALVSRLEEEPHRNPSTATMEFALRDPDGYYVMVSALSA